MKLDEIFASGRTKGWLEWSGKGFAIHAKPSQDLLANRETLARFYVECRKVTPHVRALFIEHGTAKHPKTLPRIVGEDPFLRMYALGEPLSLILFHEIWKHIGTDDPLETINPFYVEWNPEADKYYDVDATPPGFLPKISINRRLKKDKEQLEQARKDLTRVATIEDPKRRKWLTMGILAHAVAYREIEGKSINVPSFTHVGRLIVYKCQKHLIAEGVRTVTLDPVESDAPPIYLCQGTELWPSQPSMVGSIMANFAAHGSATAAYAHSWRRIHKHLRDLNNGQRPYVAGHSMGGSLAMQIGLYSHDLVEKVYAFNPPMPNERDYEFYHSMDEERQNKIIVTANLDDFAFWRIGARVIGRVTLFLSKRRWRYYPVGLWDCIFLLPAFIKFLLNVRHAFPAHQNIFALSENFVHVQLSQPEIEKENVQRATRFDYLHFFPKLYDPTKTLFKFFRKLIGWRMEAQFLRNEIEIIALHERDLIDTLTEENKEEIERELQELARQKEMLRQQLLS